MATLQTTTINDTGFLQLPRGTTAQRPSSPNVGDLRYNTDINDIEAYDGALWKRRTGGSVIASGGTKETFGQYTRHKFTSTGTSTFTVSSAGYIDYIVVAGGGSANNQALDNGGGGAGGIVVRYKQLVTAGTYPITVGVGGTTKAGNGDNGDNSTAFGVTALGGGGGGDYSAPGVAGGSGGGSSEDGPNDPGGAATQPGSADGGYGHRGGAQPNANNNHGGGGGGAGEPGEDATTSVVGNGGKGMFFGAVFGTDVGEYGWFGGGGAGGGLDGTNGFGGIGGGGNGATGAFNVSAGLPNTGGGGGGGANNASTAGGSNAAGANGGSGVVIIRYLS